MFQHCEFPIQIVWEPTSFVISYIDHSVNAMTNRLFCVKIFTTWIGCKVKLLIKLCGFSWFQYWRLFLSTFLCITMWIIFWTLSFSLLEFKIIMLLCQLNRQINLVFNCRIYNTYACNWMPSSGSKNESVYRHVYTDGVNLCIVTRLYIQSLVYWISRGTTQEVLR